MHTANHKKATESHKNASEIHPKESEHRLDSVVGRKKNFGDFKTPVIDVNQLISHCRRNAETSSAIIQILTDSARAVARSQAGILRSNAEQALKASKDTLNHSTSKSPASRQADFASSWLNFNVKSLREITEISTKSMREAFDVINKRIVEQAKELTDAASSASHSSRKKAA